MTPPSLRSLCVVLALAALTGCTNGKKNANAGAGTVGDGDYVNGTPLSERREGVSFLDPSVAKGQFTPIHFAFDSYSVGPEEADHVHAVASALQGSASTVIIAGFTDERGTGEYNRALGEKRAASVREKLIANGLGADRIQTVSFGAEMPADPGSGEAAWARNRRAEFGVAK